MTDTKRSCIQTDAAPSAIGPYSQAVVCDSWVYCSGQIALDPEAGAMVDGGIEAQTEQVLRNLLAVLKASGADYSSVVKTTIYLVDLGDFQTVNEIYGRAFGEARPARATVEVSALPKGALVEIDCVARC